MVSEGKLYGNFTKDREIHARAICGVQLKDRKTAKDTMLMLGLN